MADRLRSCQPADAEEARATAEPDEPALHARSAYVPTERGVVMDTYKPTRKPILCLDFDGVLHSYTSGWQGATIIPDPPVPGAIAFLYDAILAFDVQIFSSRSHQDGGIEAMQDWLSYHEGLWCADQPIRARTSLLLNVTFPTEKPAAFLTIDDRALTFDGTWPAIETLKAFKPWNKQSIGPTGKFPQGHYTPDDEGELQIAIAVDSRNGKVVIQFGKPTAWIGMGPAEAKALGLILIAKARAARGRS